MRGTALLAAILLLVSSGGLAITNGETGEDGGHPDPDALTISALPRFDPPEVLRFDIEAGEVGAYDFEAQESFQITATNGRERSEAGSIAFLLYPRDRLDAPSTSCSPLPENSAAILHRTGATFFHYESLIGFQHTPVHPAGEYRLIATANVPVTALVHFDDYAQQTTRGILSSDFGHVVELEPTGLESTFLTVENFSSSGTGSQEITFEMDLEVERPASMIGSFLVSGMMNTGIESIWSQFSSDENDSCLSASRETPDTGLEHAYESGIMVVGNLSGGKNWTWTGGYETAAASETQPQALAAILTQGENLTIEGALGSGGAVPGGGSDGGAGGAQGDPRNTWWVLLVLGALVALGMFALLAYRTRAGMGKGL